MTWLLIFSFTRRLDVAYGSIHPATLPDGMVAQDYLGVEKTYYQPTDRGHEQVMGEYLEKFKKLRNAHPPRPTGS